MRLWSLHPQYLDSKGLVALWREALLARKVLEGKTNGYTHHPQLARFRRSARSLVLINMYLKEIFNEGEKRGYRFDQSKLNTDISCNGDRIEVTSGQLKYERLLLESKLEKRDKTALDRIMNANQIEVVGIFKEVDGEIAEWEKVIPGVLRRLNVVRG